MQKQVMKIRGKIQGTWPAVLLVEGVDHRLTVQFQTSNDIHKVANSDHLSSQIMEIRPEEKSTHGVERTAGVYCLHELMIAIYPEPVCT